ncbi:Mucin-16, partial [Manis pentadactyla]
SLIPEPDFSSLMLAQLSSDVPQHSKTAPQMGSQEDRDFRLGVPGTLLPFQ